MKWDSEEQMALALKAWLERQGYTVYPELDGIDIVATRPDADLPEGKRVLGIECKLRPCVHGLYQAHRTYASGVVHEPWVAVGIRRLDEEYALLTTALHLGVICCWQRHVPTAGVDPDEWPCVTEVTMHPAGRHDLSNAFALTAPALGSDRLLPLMCPEATAWTTPGRASPTSWTKYRLQELQMADFVRDHPGATIDTALAAVLKPGLNRRTGLPKKIPKSKRELWTFFVRAGKAKLVEFVPQSTVLRTTAAYTELPRQYTTAVIPEGPQ